MANEARIKLSVDAAQAQSTIKLVDRQLTELGKGANIDLGASAPTRDSSSNEPLLREASKVNRTFDKALSFTKELNSKFLSKLDAIEKGIGASRKKEAPAPTPKETPNPSPTPSLPLGGKGGLEKIIGKMATGAAVATAINGVVRYVKAGAEKSKNNELAAYKVYSPIGEYAGRYDEGRDNSAELGIPYGYKTEETLASQKALSSTTGSATNSDTSELLRTARSLVLNEGSLANAFGSAYNTGAFSVGEMDRFTGMFASTLKEAGMFGRQDEQLEILNQISDLLDRNLTAVTEGQYKSTLGLYSLFSSSSKAMSGESAMNLVNGLNTALTSDSGAVDLALGKWSGRYNSNWEFEKAKEAGVSNPENLRSLLTSFEQFNGVESLSSDNAKYAFQQFLKSVGVDLNTTQVETIAKNEKKIKAGTYTLDTSEGKDVIDEKQSDYQDSKLSTMMEYEARKSANQEQLGNTVNEISSKLQDLYNDMPGWLQKTIDVGGAATSGLASFGVSAVGGAVGGKLLGGAVKSGKSLLGGLLGKGSGEAAKAVAGTSDDIAKGAASLAGAAGDAASGIGAASKVLKGVSKWAPLVGAGIDAVTTGIEVSKDLKRGDSREAANDTGSGIGSVSGGLAGAAAGAQVGAAIGTALFPGAGTAVGGAIGGIVGGIGGSLGGGKLGEKAGDYFYTATSGRGYSIDKGQYERLSKYYNEVKNLYEKKGNNAAQDYTNKTVVPYLKEIGVSESVYKAYKYDIGKPDFLNDYEAGKFNIGKNTKSYAIGNDYVAYDGVPAVLHKGEAVLNAHEATKWRSRTSETEGPSVSRLEIRVTGKIEGMSKANQDKITNEITKSIRASLKRDKMLSTLSNNHRRRGTQM